MRNLGVTRVNAYFSNQGVTRVIFLKSNLGVTRVNASKALTHLSVNTNAFFLIHCDIFVINHVPYLHVHRISPCTLTIEQKTSEIIIQFQDRTVIFSQCVKKCVSVNTYVLTLGCG
jgi:hypothetical protein